MILLSSIAELLTNRVLARWLVASGKVSGSGDGDGDGGGSDNGVFIGGSTGYTPRVFQVLDWCMPLTDAFVFI